MVDTGWMGGLTVEARKGLGGLISGEREDPVGSVGLVQRERGRICGSCTQRERERERERERD